MHITLLVMQRKEKYPGQYGPEVMAVVDEFTQDETPGWWPEEVQKHKSDMGAEADAWAEVKVRIPTAALLTALYPQTDVIEGTVI